MMALSRGRCAELACILEVAARKPGNVHRECDFEDVGFLDFVRSARAVAPVIERAPDLGVGRTVFECVRSTRHAVGTNTNLGIVLLLAPLAVVPDDIPLHGGLSGVLERLTPDDARQVYAAIRLANPGGLGRADREDVAGDPSQGLRAVMGLAAHRDLVARQYADDYLEVWQDGLPALTAGLAEGLGWEDAVIRCHLTLMARHPDTLIARKRGPADAAESAQRAAGVLDAHWPHGDEARRRFQELDRWLRAVGHQRNPGATADLVAACLFAALRDGTMDPPIAECRALAPEPLQS